jgi:pantoate--beta-alanine ligase
MIIYSSVLQLQNHLNSVQNSAKIVGFVPTMGALHKGHISLIHAAAAECDIVICSIFVNPTQFNDLSDLEKYPRSPEKDAQMLEQAGCDILFQPSISEIYTEEELRAKKEGKEDKSWTAGRDVDFGTLDKVMEGSHRPGHFNGVAQVVSKLFRIVKPQKAFFGQKDFQQLAIIRSMVKQLDLPVEVVSCPIEREPGGLAMSSRNERLSSSEREKAAAISAALFKASLLSSVATPQEIKASVLADLRNEPAFNVEYVEIADRDTLLPVFSREGLKNAVLCVALKLGPVRLIDNVLL